MSSFFLLLKPFFWPKNLLSFINKIYLCYPLRVHHSIKTGDYNSYRIPCSAVRGTLFISYAKIAPSIRPLSKGILTSYPLEHLNTIFFNNGLALAIESLSSRWTSFHRAILVKSPPILLRMKKRVLSCSTDYQLISSQPITKKLFTRPFTASLHLWHQPVDYGIFVYSVKELGRSNFSFKQR